MIALAHHVEDLVERGVLSDYADAARILGLTNARVTQVMNLLQLAPDLQEGLLLGNLNVPERRLRVGLRCPDWAAQRAAIEGGG